MIYVTGDTHASFGALCETVRGKNLTSEDLVIILGDAGFNFFGAWADRVNKMQVNSLGVPVFCVHGNHEMRPAATGLYQLKDWHGGQVWVEEDFPNLLFGRDGDIYDMDGKSVAVIGGAYSVDKFHRIARDPHNPKWWPDEQPDDATKARVEARLAAHGWKVDYVLSHTCPLRYEPVEMFLPGLDYRKVDRSTEEWLDRIEERLDYRTWYCGHWHTNKTRFRMHFLFHDMVPLGE